MFFVFIVFFDSQSHYQDPELSFISRRFLLKFKLRISCINYCYLFKLGISVSETCVCKTFFVNVIIILKVYKSITVLR